MSDHLNIRRAYSNYRARCLENGKTVDQRDLAKELGVSSGFISHLMTGKNPLSLSRAIQLATILGCTVDDLSPRLAAELEASAKGIKIADQTVYQTVGYVDDDVVDFFKAISSGKAVKVTEFMHWPHPHSKETYAVEVTSKGMEPRIAVGTIVIIDTELDAQVDKVSALLVDGQFLLAENMGNRVFTLANKSFPQTSFELTDNDLHVGRVIGLQVNDI